MMCEPLSGAHLFFPPKSFLGIVGELDVIWRISVNKIAATQRHRFEVTSCELPFLKNIAVVAKVPRIVDPLVITKRDIEFSASIESAQSIIPCSVQVIEKGCGLGAFRTAIREQLVESAAMRIKKFFIVFHPQGNELMMTPALRTAWRQFTLSPSEGDRAGERGPFLASPGEFNAGGNLSRIACLGVLISNQQALFEPAIEVDQLRVAVIQKSFARRKTQGHSQSSAEWFNQPVVGIRRPVLSDVRDQPTFATRPFERRAQQRGG